MLIPRIIECGAPTRKSLRRAGSVSSLVGSRRSKSRRGRKGRRVALIPPAVVIIAPRDEVLTVPLNSMPQATRWPARRTQGLDTCLQHFPNLPAPADELAHEVARSCDFQNPHIPREFTEDAEVARHFALIGAEAR